MILSHIKKVDVALAAFPKFYYRVSGASGERYGESILSEMEIWKNIMGCHYDDMHQQDMRNNDSAQNRGTKSPNSFNTNVYVISPHM